MLEAAQDIWAGYVTHPFVLGLADGSLAVEKFQFYLLQDYVYLFDYAKVFAQGVVKARDPEVMRAFASYVDSILNGDLDEVIDSLIAADQAAKLSNMNE